uniref:Photosystem II oxygen-evolving enhancer protein 2 n=1 Tax=Tetraselmis sp. GSL018 TaxID=582737 RepID=A0A061S851_9CHLO|mmetsp:Transcript_16968/g.40474  ORF Transcript_16968/g.40474 Transcript_16968/m.40474 type:complete len:255 (+) Transcript_16968:179-943(+)|eukprot:CAMPEP_0177599996 /NCGR_PEP_ID=MMETSP0419_2-20121207/13350_1 /TAXON_ID=582737 /ORGANISM="Tetraselmis sp., Strain GSL018" /LENGTH=254 /DNA_ID=CAMNT_0019092885 /DNA_START=120 /DNA_END=884 /DNA_ORIENTATION=-
MSAITSAPVAKGAFLGQTSQLRSKSGSQAPLRASLRIRAEADQTSRRAALGLAAGAALLSQAKPSVAAYGDAANVFGKATNTSGFVPYAGEGYALLLPSKWNPSTEQDFPNIDLRYEDNFDAVNNLIVSIKPTDKKSIEDYGAPEKFLPEVTYLLGQQSFEGATKSEGGFAENRVSAASLLGTETVTDKKGKVYYKYNILARSADGDEGGRHQLISATVSEGNLYVLKVQVGDKRWFKGVDKEAMGAWNSFIVA